MLFLGITGGVGAGKTEILHHIETTYRSRILSADEIAHTVMEPGTDCHAKLQSLLGADDVWQPDGRFDRAQLAAVLFSDSAKRSALDAIVHPAVKADVIAQAKQARAEGEIDLLVLEAALLIEENYDEICDELWYIYTSEENRRARLRADRGYSDARIDATLASQLSEEIFRAHCAVVIDNNGTPEEAFDQVDERLMARGIRTR